MQIRNRLGVDRSSPTEFVQNGRDGKPALRNGVSLALWHSKSRRWSSRFDQVYANDPVKPKRESHFTPKSGSRPLAPLEAFEAMRLDLNDCFDLTSPGNYRFHVSFAADSGVGEGISTDLYFQVGGSE